MLRKFKFSLNLKGINMSYERWENNLTIINWLINTVRAKTTKLYHALIE